MNWFIVFIQRITEKILSSRLGVACTDALRSKQCSVCNRKIPCRDESGKLHDWHAFKTEKSGKILYLCHQEDCEPRYLNWFSTLLVTIFVPLWGIAIAMRHKKLFLIKLLAICALMSINPVTNAASVIHAPLALWYFVDLFRVLGNGSFNGNE